MKYEDIIKQIAKNENATEEEYALIAENLTSLN